MIKTISACTILLCLGCCFHSHKAQGDVSMIELNCSACFNLTNASTLPCAWCPPFNCSMCTSTENETAAALGANCSLCSAREDNIPVTNISSSALGATCSEDSECDLGFTCNLPILSFIGIGSGTCALQMCSDNSSCPPGFECEGAESRLFGMSGTCVENFINDTGTLL